MAKKTVVHYLLSTKQGPPAVPAERTQNTNRAGVDSHRIPLSREGAAMKSPKSKTLATKVPLNFLLGCPQDDVASFQLARLAAVADLRKQLYNVLDLMIEQTAVAMLAEWFRDSDRDAIKRALDAEESPMDWAIRLIRERQRGEGGKELLPLPALPRGAAHLAAALRDTERNLAEGKCGVCPKPLDRNFVRYCSEHLRTARSINRLLGWLRLALAGFSHDFGQRRVLDLDALLPLAQLTRDLLLNPSQFLHQPCVVLKLLR
jgi:hypothetical protein